MGDYEFILHSFRMLISAVKMKRTPIRRKPKRNPTPPAVYKEVCLRSGGMWIEGRCKGGLCENPECGSWRGLQFSHTRHRGMGGTNNPEIHSAKNIRRLCAVCHDKLDGR